MLCVFAGDISLKCRKDLESEMRVIADSMAVDDDIKFDHTTSSHEGQTKHEGQQEDVLYLYIR